MENDETPVNKENFHKISFKFKISSFLMIKINMENDGTPRNKQNSTNRFISDLFQSHYLALYMFFTPLSSKVSFGMSIYYTELLLKAIFFKYNTLLFNLTHKLIIFNSQKGYY